MKWGEDNEEEEEAEKIRKCDQSNFPKTTTYSRRLWCKYLKNCDNFILKHSRGEYLSVQLSFFCFEFTEL